MLERPEHTVYISRLRGANDDLAASCSCGWEVVGVLSANYALGDWERHVLFKKSRPEAVNEDLRGVSLRLHEEIREAGEKIRELAVELHTELPREADLGQLVAYVVERARWARKEFSRIEDTIKEVWPNPPEEYDVCDVIRDMAKSVKLSEEDGRGWFRQIVSALEKIKRATDGAGIPTWSLEQWVDYLVERYRTMLEDRNLYRGKFDVLKNKLAEIYEDFL